MTAGLQLFDLLESKNREKSFSPMVWRAKLSLNHKGVTYETIPVTFLDIPTLIPQVWYVVCCVLCVVSMNFASFCCCFKSKTRLTPMDAFDHNISWSHTLITHFLHCSSTTTPSNKISPNVTAPTVPTLKIADGEGLQDSLAIAEYVEKNYPKGPSIFGATPSEKHLQLFFDSYVSTRLHPAIQRLVFIEMYEHQDAENAAYFKSSREKGGKTLEQLGGDRAQNMKELKENLGLIHSALLRSGGWITGEQRTYCLCCCFEGKKT
jgi:glutathione S-transferase